MPDLAPPLLSWGRKHQPHRYRNELRRYAQFCCFVLTSGELHAAFASGPGAPWREQVVRRGQAIILPASADFDLWTPHGPYHGHMVEWSAAACPLPPLCVILTAEQAVLATLADIETEYARGDGVGLLPLLYQVLALRLLRQFSQAAGATEVAADRIDERLRAHVHTDASLVAIFGGESDLRRARRMYRAARGQSPKRALLEMKLAEGERLLRLTRLDITAIALDLGFPSAQHFATQFRRWRGKTPGDVRRQGQG